MCNAALWSAQREALSPQYVCEVGDISAGDSIAELAEQVLDQAPEHFALAGLSMGGIVAMAMWAQQPQRIVGLALLDTNYKADTTERQLQRDRQVQQVASGGLDAVLRDELKPNYMAQCHRQNVALLDEVLAMGLALGSEVFVRQSVALRERPDSAATLSAVTCPTLILCGEEDTLCPVSLHQEMAALVEGAHLEVIANCGHLSSMEQPARVTQALRTWLQRI